MSNSSRHSNPLEHNDAAVLKHMDMYQDIITRMASNRTACKHWCIILISAFLAFVFKNQNAEVAWLGVIPIILFCFLDTYYLGLEKTFRQAFNTSAEKIRESRFYLADLFMIKANGKLPDQMLKDFKSFSTWPLYLCLLILLILANQFAGVGGQ